MARLGPLSIDRLGAVPADALRALRLLPKIAANTRAMAKHTALLSDVSDALNRVATDTAELPAMRADMADVSEAVAVLGAMDTRMTAIEEAMPVLVEV